MTKPVITWDACAKWSEAKKGGKETELKLVLFQEIVVNTEFH